MQLLYTAYTCPHTCRSTCLYTACAIREADGTAKLVADRRSNNSGADDNQDAKQCPDGNAEREPDDETNGAIPLSAITI